MSKQFALNCKSVHINLRVLILPVLRQDFPHPNTTNCSLHAPWTFCAFSVHSPSTLHECSMHAPWKLCARSMQAQCPHHARYMWPCCIWSAMLYLCPHVVFGLQCCICVATLFFLPCCICAISVFPKICLEKNAKPKLKIKNVKRMSKIKYL